MAPDLVEATPPGEARHAPNANLVTRLRNGDGRSVRGRGRQHDGATLPRDTPTLAHDGATLAHGTLTRARGATTHASDSRMPTARNRDAL